ncbi:hypothetical protein PROFUN_05809 [Planoprotostelium fungivorum]|uniref:Uncharacterized protein n=1 Tax=Planoprotostelium fungivorum TaxID=1890364 RepID=A0A2P6NQ60_9EUKA|nr:hypothetical protein PROFUN_05809 [Planoprotostelium fungivorum]
MINFKQGAATVIAAASAAAIVILTTRSDVSPFWRFNIFFPLLSTFLLAWCVVLPSPIRYSLSLAIFAAFFDDSYERSGSLSTSILSTIVVLLLTIGTQSRTMGHTINTYKCMLFDWVILILGLVGTGLADLFFHTNLFFFLLSYFVGANMIGLGVYKLCDRLWHNDMNHNDDTEEETIMHFLHMSSITHKTWSRLGLRELVFIFTLFFHMLLNSTYPLSRWQWGLFIGCYSTLYAYLGLVASGKPLSRAEFIELQDATN